MLVVAGGITWKVATRANLSPVERGRRLAERYGCFGCHGAEGGGGVYNSGRADITVPNWRDDLMMFAKDTSQIRQWIENGVTDSRAQSQTWRTQRDKGVLKMPAFGKFLSKNQVADLVALVMFAGGQLRPNDSAADLGYYRADSLGCFGCHGDGGWLSRPNPGSLKGYVASWATADFTDLVRDRAEFDEWVKTGTSTRITRNRLANYFLTHSALRMPAYRDHLRPGDLDALWAYVQWLR